MNKNCMENKANVVISAKCIDDREIKEAFGESVMRICWEAFSCGVFVGMESSEAYVFATDMDARPASVLSGIIGELRLRWKMPIVPKALMA